MEPLVEGIFQCPQCKKIIKQKVREKEVKEEIDIDEGEFQDGDYFHKNASLNIKDWGLVENYGNNLLDIGQMKMKLKSAMYHFLLRMLSPLIFT